MVIGVTDTASSGKKPDNNDEEQPPRQRNWMALAGIATAAYGCFLASTIQLHRIWDFMNHAVALNEIGDFLAGVFAPVAFVWLVAAVLTQRQELLEARAQFNKSQDETRTQFNAGQEVTRRQLDLVDNANTNQKDQAIREYKLSLFEHRFEIFEKFDAIARDEELEKHLKSHASAIYKLAQRSLFVFGPALPEKLASVAKMMREASRIKSGMQNYYMKSTFAVPTNFKDEDDKKKFENMKASYDAKIKEIKTALKFSNRTDLFRQYMTVADPDENVIEVIVEDGLSSGIKKNDNDGDTAG